jgi:hypothetical protein
METTSPKKETSEIPTDNKKTPKNIPSKGEILVSAVDVSTKINFDVSELKLIKAVFLEYNTSVKTAYAFLKVISKIDFILKEVEI